MSKSDAPAPGDFRCQCGALWAKRLPTGEVEVLRSGLELWLEHVNHLRGRCYSCKKTRFVKEFRL